MTTPLNWLELLFGAGGDDNVSYTPQTTHAWRDTSTTGTATAASVAVRSRRRRASTTTNAASQVVDSGGAMVSAGEDFALPNSSTVVVDVLLVARKSATALGTTVKLSGSFLVTDLGVVTRIGTDDMSEKAGTFTLSAALVINGSRVEVQVSPSVNVTLEYLVARQQSEVSL